MKVYMSNQIYWFSTKKYGDLVKAQRDKAAAEIERLKAADEVVPLRLIEFKNDLDTVCISYPKPVRLLAIQYNNVMNAVYAEAYAREKQKEQSEQTEQKEEQQ